MMNFKTTVSALVLIAGVASPLAASANPINLRPVYDSRGHHVMDFRGNCVRTSWQTQGDECAPDAKAVVATPAPTPGPGDGIHLDRPHHLFRFR